MTKRTILVGALALAALGYGVSVTAQGPGRRGQGPGEAGFGPRFGPPLERMAEKLGLSDQQKQQLEAMRAQHEQTLKPLLEAGRKAHEAFEKALEADGADAAQVGQAALAMKTARDKVEAAHKAGFEDLKSILTPEQLEKVESARGRGFGRGDGPGSGPRHRGGPGSDPSDK